ncbi:hypothetical protein LLE49_11225 [Alicyclobacillus tolerans]|uniref:hypothetical protein n=1 Tax=Alicyclobacillus tolerans TaxID=90970 RepID=UPI001F2568E4|nr:hypothetical protein [Alicyclobacillus tolerans]MCF8565287.1 hypothetical protein [Alicyclobacillus tolerans]
MFQCPICGELMEMLTNIHCVKRHQTTRKECIELYGPPKYVTPTMNREIQRWIRDSQVISKLDFDIAQAAARNQLRRQG